MWGSPYDDRFASGSFLPDRFNQGGAAVIAKRRIVARIAWPDRAFRRLQANGEALDGARDLIERNPAPFEEGRCPRFFGGLFPHRVLPRDGTIRRACPGGVRAVCLEGGHP